MLIRALGTVPFVFSITPTNVPRSILMSDYQSNIHSNTATPVEEQAEVNGVCTENTAEKCTPLAKCRSPMPPENQNK